ncbi:MULTISPECIES: 4Fe-4S binding protein [Methylococcus]|jgi:ferredoxin-type protein NapH|uniref:4Fe-4S binding protein n=1 Tax=Methylococcus TaxID=413 RepID=UPI001C5275EC|nr:4Fe-4S binding protein [Methylococcus capsulatus]QXP88751.1 4Fe-4S binding protein [Methylococcus capsulatus]QXP89871.1 4Fe-4S binding protein [Methylococcus capsulatus]QXP94218.1 4Fe-4S binding protein [Methylococcus capsulatus]UQN11032.1 4Fe-4S binding protein [Methylococcus capsulatus]
MNALTAKLTEKIRSVPKIQRYRYFWIAVSCAMFLGPLAVLPGLAGNTDLCGKLCMRRFYLYFPGMSWDDLFMHVSVALIGVVAFFVIITFTFFFGRIWCSFICPVGGFSELVSRMLSDRWKIEYRGLPQVQIRYGYLAVYMGLLPLLGVSACTLCNFITVPRFVEALSGGFVGLAFIFSTVGLVNLSLLFLLGFFASKGRAYCQFLCPIGAIDGLVNRLGAKFRFTHHIRVDKQRCTGCTECAKKCMCGAIKMVDKVAVVDQFSCMSCHDCVDACDWNAIEWTTAPRNKTPKRVKRGIQIHPEPQWQAVVRMRPKPAPTARVIHWGRVVNGVIVAGFSVFLFATAVWLH